MFSHPTTVQIIRCMQYYLVLISVFTKVFIYFLYRCGAPNLQTPGSNLLHTQNGGELPCCCTQRHIAEHSLLQPWAEVPHHWPCCSRPGWDFMFDKQHENSVKFIMVSISWFISDAVMHKCKKMLIFSQKRCT